MSVDRELFTAPAAAAGTPASLLSASGTETFRARCWGTRGSLPSPGPDTVHYGGNTSCLEVIGPSGERLIFDAGSGIRPLGDDLARLTEALRADLFLTHFHWDHIQGLPFFGPMYDENSSLCIHGARQGDVDVQSLIAGQMGPVYFPVPFEAVAARLQFRHLDQEPVERGALLVTSHRVRHPNDTYGFRVDCGGSSLVYMPDNELQGGHYNMPADWYASLQKFVHGADVLLHDAMLTDAEYGQFEGWGHSSVSQAIRLAEESGVKRLVLFHHSPGRTDAQLRRMADDAREDMARRGSTLSLDVAAEGEQLAVEELT